MGKFRPHPMNDPNPTALVNRRFRALEQTVREDRSARRLESSSIGDEYTMTPEGPKESDPMPLPDGLTITAGTERIKIVWSGSASEVIPADFGRLAIHASKVPGYAPTQGTEVATVSSPYGGSAIYAADGGDTYYIRCAVASLRGDYGEFTPEVAVTAGALAVGAQTFRQDEPPTAGESYEGDIWFDTNDGNAQYRYESGAWVRVPVTAIVNADSDILIWGENAYLYGDSDVTIKLGPDVLGGPPRAQVRLYDPSTDYGELRASFERDDYGGTSAHAGLIVSYDPTLPLASPVHAVRMRPEPGQRLNIDAHEVRAPASYQAGHVDVTVAAASTRYTQAVTFPEPFLVAPEVMVTPYVVGVETAFVSATDITATGFTLNYYRTNTANMTVGWTAVAP